MLILLPSYNFERHFSLFYMFKLVRLVQIMNFHAQKLFIYKSLCTCTNNVVLSEYQETQFYK